MKKMVIFALITTFCLIAFSVNTEKAITVMKAVPITEISSSEETTTSETSAVTETTTTATPATTTLAETTTVPVQSNTELESQINAICQKYNVVGMSMAVFKGQDILYTQSYGYADIAGGIAANENTKFRIASVSKTITGILAMRLVSDGKLNLDEDISNYMGINMKSPNYPDTPITTRQLMTHTSGIVDSSAYETITDTYTYPSLQGLMEYGGMYSQYMPGTRYIYSNLAAGLVCGVIEGITQQRFYTYAKDTLFTPLNMDAGFLRTQIADTNNIALIYKNKIITTHTDNIDITSKSSEVTAHTKTWGRVESAYDTIPIGQMYLLGYGDLFITASDLAKFGIALAGDGTYNGFQVLQNDYVNQMNTLQFQAGNNKRGLSTSITSHLVKGRTMYGHPGQSYGMVSGLYYDPADSTGVVFITNGCNVQKNSYGIYTIADEIVKTAYSSCIDN